MKIFLKIPAPPDQKDVVIEQEDRDANASANIKRVGGSTLNAGDVRLVQQAISV